MGNSFMQGLIAERIGGKKFGRDMVFYKFEKIKRAKQAAMAEHPDIPIIDMGIGEPDAMADRAVIDTLYREAQKWQNRDYADNGIDAFKQAAADYLKDVYGVADIDPETEINHSVGSKTAMAMLPQAFINPGEITLATVPGYGVQNTTTEWLGGEVYTLPLTAQNHFLPDLTAIPQDILKRAKLFYMNYPNNPTGATATREFYEQAIEFARKNNIMIIQDAAYAPLTFDGERPLSFLSVPGAKEVGVEVHSLSKAFNMTGWRIAFVAGNELAVHAFATVKDCNDSGQFKAIQYAGIYAMAHPEITARTAEKYSRRHDMLLATLGKFGFEAHKPKASFYLFVPIPKGVEGGENFDSAEAFMQYLLREKQISVVPWDEVGNYIRLSVTYPANGEAEEKAVMAEMERRLSDVRFRF